MLPGGKPLPGMVAAATANVSVTGLPGTAKIPPPGAALLRVTWLNVKVSEPPAFGPFWVVVALKTPPPCPDATARPVITRSPVSPSMAPGLLAVVRWQVYREARLIVAPGAVPGPARATGAPAGNRPAGAPCPAKPAFTTGIVFITFPSLPRNSHAAVRFTILA